MWIVRVQRTYGTTGRLDRDYTPRTYMPREGDPPTASYYAEHTPLMEPISPILPWDPPRDHDVVEPILRKPNIDPRKLGAAISQLPLTLVLDLLPRGQHC